MDVQQTITWATESLLTDRLATRNAENVHAMRRKAANHAIAWATEQRPSQPPQHLPKIEDNIDIHVWYIGCIYVNSPYLIKRDTLAIS